VHTTTSSIEVRDEILGSGFLLGADVNLRRAGSPDVVLTDEVVIPGRINTTIPAGSMAAGYWDVWVINPDGSSGVLENGFLVPLVSVAWCEMMDTDPGFTMDGGWAYGVPLGNAGDPSSGNSGANVLGYNLAGEYPDNMPEEYATSPVIDLTGFANLQLSFYRWLGVESSSFDHARLQWSTNGTAWNLIWENAASSMDESSWSFQSYTLPAAVNGSPSFQFRFEMGTTDGSVTFQGWNIDDLKLTEAGASSVPPVFTSTSTNVVTEGVGYAYNITTSDADTPGSSLILSISNRPAWLTFVDNGDGTASLSGTPGPGDVGTHPILLRVSDGLYTTWQIFNLSVFPLGGNTPPQILTTNLPNANVNLVYTGTVAAIDADGHAVALSVSGLPGWAGFTDLGNNTGEITGTPTDLDIGTHFFNLHATDGFDPVQVVLPLVVQPSASIEVVSSGVSVDEDVGSAEVVINVRRIDNSEGPVTVDFATANGSANAGADYTATNGTVSWADGDLANKQIVVPILDDLFTEGNENFTVTLSNPAGIAQLGADTVTTVTILDDENNTPPAPQVTKPSIPLAGIPNASLGMILEGVVNDDGFPLVPGTTTWSWVQTEGPPATIGDINALSTWVTFPSNGVYTFELTANDGEFSGAGSVRVRVGSGDTITPGTGLLLERYLG
ncbi:MAG: Calx-beta domain-containing protein, partial [Verrucomicrobiota bacterium]